MAFWIYTNNGIVSIDGVRDPYRITGAQEGTDKKGT